MLDICLRTLLCLQKLKLYYRRCYVILGKESHSKYKSNTGLPVTKGYPRALKVNRAMTWENILETSV